jgi:hypothetical protein
MFICSFLYIENGDVVSFYYDDNKKASETLSDMIYGNVWILKINESSKKYVRLYQELFEFGI